MMFDDDPQFYYRGDNIGRGDDVSTGCIYTVGLGIAGAIVVEIWQWIIHPLLSSMWMD